MKRINSVNPNEACEILGRIIEQFMDNPHGPAESQKRISSALSRSGLEYQPGGRILGAAEAIPARSVGAIIQERDISGLREEFDRALANVEKDPETSITAASSLLESLFKVYIDENKLPPPNDQSIRPLWSVVQKHLNLNPAATQRDDLRKICSGLSSIVDGIGALRTHSGSAHGHGKLSHTVSAADARLSVHAAFTLAVFVMEKWGK
jgi:hypothetical protein